MFPSIGLGVISIKLRRFEPREGFLVHVNKDFDRLL